MRWLIILLLVTMTTKQALTYRILIVAPTPSISHQLPFHFIADALVDRGHHVTMITCNPIKLSSENYTEIDISKVYKVLQQVNFVEWARMSPAEELTPISQLWNIVSDYGLNLPVMQDFIRKNQTFDLFILEWLGYQSYYGLWHKVGSPPLVGALTLPAMVPVYEALGNTQNPAYLPDVWVGFSDHMTFKERLYSVYMHLYWMYLWKAHILPDQEKLMRKHFGDEPPSVFQTQRNHSLFMVNSHFVSDYPRPNLPTIVEITGLHVKTENKVLPKEIQEFLDGAEHGVIYFSLGSNVRSNALPDEKRQAFIEAFRELPQRVLWKWESDSLPDQPHNLMISKWLPQQDVLAHPKLRLFITQGGLQSYNEASYHAVPMIAIPFFADQPHIAAKIHAAGIGRRLEYVDITKETLLNAMRSVLNESKYQQTMDRFSAVYREHKATSLERAVWWLEYVVRHRGAPHMRTAALDLHWWQLLLLDVIAFVLAVAALTATVLYFVVRRLLRLVFRSGSNKLKTQ